MAETEFIIALSEHRYLGNIFLPYLIKKEEQYYTVINHVKPRDLNSDSDYQFKPYEKELVEIIERYSDERLKKRFSRAGSVNEFYKTLKPDYFRKTVSPFIEYCMFQIASILMLGPVRLLNKEMKYANLYDEDEIEIQTLYAKPVFYFTRTENETRYRLKIFQNEKEVSLQNSNIRIITNEPCIFVRQDKLYVFEKLNAKKLIPFFEKEEVRIPHSIDEKYYGGFVLNTIRNFEVQVNGFEIVEDSADKKAVLSLEKNLENQPRLVLYFYYGKEKFLQNSKRKLAVSLQKTENSYLYRKVERNFDWEIQICSSLDEIGLIENGGFYVPVSNTNLINQEAFYSVINWININKPKIDELKIEIIQNKTNQAYFTGLQKLEIKSNEKDDWFDIQASVQFGEYSIPFIKLKKHILNGIREFELPNGEIAILPEEWFARFKGLISFAKITDNKIEFEKHHFQLIKDALKESVKSFAAKLNQMNFQDNYEISLPQKLNVKLRSYQRVGFNWMFQLNKNEFGGCLADDMGLGKTIQTLALLLKLKRQKSAVLINQSLPIPGQLDLFEKNKEVVETQPASIIVLPTSLVHNWASEIKKFTPTLKVFKYVGIQRKKVAELEKIIPYYDVILTTYGTVRNDINILSKLEFFYAILDESQYIKNSTSKTYKAIVKLRSKYKLVLTGTPIENSLADLWSQMNFLNPGLLGNRAFFQKAFITPIEKFADEKQQEQLQLIIRPFILRRKKDEVAKDLPPLTEQVIYCNMAEQQKSKYEEEKSVIRNAILESIEKEGMKKSTIAVLQGLTKLRQLANHPSLLNKEDEESSGKFDQMMSMLENLVAEKHKVLIFSSFVTHLELVKKHLESKKWRYSMLTGKTTKREKVINEFQNDSENHVFLISLKAGGVGLNLTKASYVFIIDPWWNPAAENQAVSRAHRIGQDKQVFVYRFITENSIEEKIQMLKNRKTSLADKFINSNNPFKEITQEDIVELFN